ncbi:VOC family protein [Sphingomonas aracearum]|uniref:VOC family protein n=1 Tax=Sphingomonas aracearum TaxID=2283317 RepID=A0A369VWB4_9SPHN|nr:VOC family protein [Sphingomonas aracearum]RDE05867.1 VOC family protein [Sphingomonas aracearum]
MNGMPIWYELMTPDVDAAKAFYGAVVGWTFTPFAVPGEGMEYTIVEVDGQGVAGMMPRPAEAPIPAGWYAYFHVEDLDAKAGEVTAAGGKVHMPASDIPNVGRIALVEDAQGVAFYLMRPSPPPGIEGVENTAFSETLPGRVAWNELVTTDSKAALGFYGDLLGWTSTEAMPMGPMGDYSFVDCGITRLGAMMDQASPDQPKRWGFYFSIPDVDAAATQVAELGGTVLMGPMEVPGGQRIVVATDPQGCPVGFVSGERP